MTRAKKQAAANKTSASPFVKEVRGFSAFTKQTLLIALTAILLYIPSLGFEYALDDGLFITDNKLTQKGFSGIGEIFTRDAFYGVFGGQAGDLLPGGRYRPLSQVMFATEYALTGLSPFTGHLVNLLLYALLCMLLLKIMGRIFQEKKDVPWYLQSAFVVSLLFTLHPLHTEVVANIKGRDELLSLLFSFIVWNTALRSSAADSGKFKIPQMLLYAGAFLLALLSKENAAVFLLIIPLSLYFFGKPSAKDYVLLLLPMLAGFAVYILLRYNALGFITNEVQQTELLNDPFIGATLSEKYATILYTWGKYLSLIVFPHPLTHDYYPKQIPVVAFSDFRVILSGFVWLLLLLVSLKLLRKKHLISFALLFFFISFSISSNLVFNIGTFMNERFMFAPLLGPCMIAGWLLQQKISETKSRKILSFAGVIFIAVSLIFFTKAFIRNFAWKNSYTLFTTDVRTSVNSAKCNIGAAEVIVKSIDSRTPENIKRQKLEQALQYAARGVEIYPGFRAGWLYKGYIERELKDYRASLYSLTKTLELSPGNSEAANYLYHNGYDAFRAGELKLSAEHFKTLTRFFPDSSDYLYLQAEVYEYMNKTDSCLILIDSVLKMDHSNYKAYNKKGEIYGRIKNDLITSEEMLLKAFSIKPGAPEVLQNLGTLYGLKSNYSLSLRFLLKADSVSPGQKSILEKISLTYGLLGDQSSAEKYAVAAGKANKP